MSFHDSDGSVRIDGGSASVKGLVTRFPKSYTFGVVQGHLILDPTHDEERFMDARVSVLCRGEEVQGVFKWGDAMSSDLLFSCLEWAARESQGIK